MLRIFGNNARIPLRSIFADFIITVMNEADLKQMLPRMGKTLKLYREKTGRNQGDVATVAGISTSMLSQIERGVVSPSIDTLLLVCHALDLDVSELFKGIYPKRPLSIHRPKERLSMKTAGIRYEQLITGRSGAFNAELFLMEVAPGAASTLSDRGHEGVEMGYVLEGEAQLSVDNKEYTVRQGDSFSFESHRPHRLHNTGTVPFKAVWAMSPPHLDYFTNAEDS